MSLPKNLKRIEIRPADYGVFVLYDLVHPNAPVTRHSLTFESFDEALAMLEAPINHTARRREKPVARVSEEEGA